MNIGKSVNYEVKKQTQFIANKLINTVSDTTRRIAGNIADIMSDSMVEILKK